MKILIINPPWPGKGYGTRSQNRIIKQRSDLYLQYPLFYGYSVSRLKNVGHELFYIDSVVQGFDKEQTLQKIKEISPDLILMETTTPSSEYDFEYMKLMKEANNPTTTTIIAVGPHVTYFPKEALEKCNAINVVIKGEYDTKIVEVVDAIKANELDKIPGITFRDQEGKIVDTGMPTYSDDLDGLPFPDRDLIPFHWYGEAWWNLKPFMNISTSRGCPFQCTFCLWPHSMETGKWRTRSIDNVMEELKFLVKQYGLKEINIDDSTFTVRKERVLEFCQKLRENNLKILWTCNARVNNVDEELLKEMKKAGCKMIRFGVESGDPEVLKKMKKGVTIEEMKHAFKITRKHGILALGGFMFGFPYDNMDSINKTLELAKELKPDMIQASIPMPYPGTPLYEEVKNEDKLLAKDWKEYDMTAGPIMKMDGVSREELMSVLNRVYKEFYFRPSFAAQTIFNTRRWSDVTRNFRTFVSLVKTVNFYRAKDKDKDNNNAEGCGEVNACGCNSHDVIKDKASENTTENIAENNVENNVMEKDTSNDKVSDNNASEK
ncbi:radical SAM protein [Candidatus Woesearchaeota archaeon]|nr:radical SAM protein [Candidatus Woesearchaeota archaeon]MBT5273162.1 radical SAM protein [Candidatus Woesearchaeota archaeon]MBT6337523.1 radical SAM protein [Candidatus Woesearchaeota archaeon]MBT7927076.1 radical SAM protein [Candidatus Woesearchaeota archaeon]